MTATHLHFDCYSGISGDMTLGALVDLGVSVEVIEQQLKGLPIGLFSLRAEKIKRQGLMGTRVHVNVEEDEHAHRHLRHILEILDAAGLPEPVVRRARQAYTALAEAAVHGSTREKIHFHEVGAKDAILDVAGAMVGVELLGAKTFSCGPVVTGSGMVECLHGMMPVPAPATAELLRGMTLKAGAIESELVTPTGASILRTLLGETDSQAVRGAAREGLRMEKVGYGAGGKTVEGQANFLRLMLCETPAEAAEKPSLPVNAHSVISLETEIDDMSPEVAGYLMERLLADGAWDVQFSPIARGPWPSGFSRRPRPSVCAASRWSAGACPGASKRWRRLWGRSRSRWACGATACSRPVPNTKIAARWPKPQGGRWRRFTISRARRPVNS